MYPCKLNFIFDLAFVLYKIQNPLIAIALLHWRIVFKLSKEKLNIYKV